MFELLRTAAYHEAGHILAGVRSGQNITGAFIGPGSGITIVAEFADKIRMLRMRSATSPDFFEYCIQRARICVAGNVSQRMFSSAETNDEASQEDFKEAEAWVEEADVHIPLGEDLKIPDYRMEVVKMFSIPENKKILRALARALVKKKMTGEMLSGKEILTIVNS